MIPENLGGVKGVKEEYPPQTPRIGLPGIDRVSYNPGFMPLFPPLPIGFFFFFHSRSYGQAI